VDRKDWGVRLLSHDPSANRTDEHTGLSELHRPRNTSIVASLQFADNFGYGPESLSEPLANRLPAIEIHEHAFLDFVAGIAGYRQGFV